MLSLSRYNILLVDAYPQTHHLLASYLREEGATVVATNHLHEMSQLILATHTHGQRFTHALIDIELMGLDNLPPFLIAQDLSTAYGDAISIAGLCDRDPSTQPLWMPEHAWIANSFPIVPKSYEGLLEHLCRNPRA